MFISIIEPDFLVKNQACIKSHKFALLTKFLLLILIKSTIIMFNIQY